MNRKDSTDIRRFRESDVKAVRDLIHHTIDVSYSPVYPSRAVKFFKEYHSEAKILERHKSGEKELEGGSTSRLNSGPIVVIRIIDWA